MRVSLRFLFGLTTWVALVALAATMSGQYLGLATAVSFAAIVATVVRERRVAAIAFAGFAGAIGMVTGYWMFAFVIPWPSWVGADARTEVQQILVENVAGVSLAWSAIGCIVGVVVAFVISVVDICFFRKRNREHSAQTMVL